MIVSVRQWTFLRPVREILRALTLRAPAERREEKKASFSVLGQFEAMMVHQANLTFRSWEKD
jgi:hypothetical protein